MKTRIGFFAMAFLLLAFANAHSQDQLGPSCKSNYMNLPIAEIPESFGTSWCWAATAQNVMDFHGQKTQQCQLVAKVYSYVDDIPCCGETVTECWGNAGRPEWVFNDFQFSYLNKTVRNKILTWEDATEEICQNRPFISSIDFDSGDRHSVVVTGYSVTKGVRIYDPLQKNTFWEPYADFFEGQSLEYERVRDTYNIEPMR